MKTPRRKRSELTEAGCFAAVRRTAKSIDRMASTSQGMDGPHSYAADGYITLMIAAKGGFGTHEDFWEALRVLGEFKLPRKG